MITHVTTCVEIYCDSPRPPFVNILTREWKPNGKAVTGPHTTKVSRQLYKGLSLHLKIPMNKRGLIYLESNQDAKKLYECCKKIPRITLREDTIDYYEFSCYFELSRDNLEQLKNDIEVYFEPSVKEFDKLDKLCNIVDG